MRVSGTFGGDKLALDGLRASGLRGVGEGGLAVVDWCPALHAIVVSEGDQPIGRVGHGCRHSGGFADLEFIRVDSQLDRGVFLVARADD